MYNHFGKITPSVEPYHMTQYGKPTHSLFTGTMTHSVPIYTYKDPDFTIPLLLTYAFDGYKPSQHSGSIGLGWSLNVGGVITREIIGQADEISTNTCKSYFELTHSTFVTSENSYIVNEKLVSLNPFSSGEQLESLNLIPDRPVISGLDENDVPGYRYDPNPDIFHMSFLDYSCDFYRDRSGKFIIIGSSNIPHGEIEVDFQYMTSHLGYQVTKFEVSTGDGYKYIFGGYFNGIEYNAMNYNYKEETVTPSAWRLTEIIAPNGKNVKFNYAEEDVLAQRSINFSCSPEVYGSSEAAASFSPDYFLLYANRTQYNYYYAPSQIEACFVKRLVPLISSIEVNGKVIIDFLYDINENHEDDTSHFLSLSSFDQESYHNVPVTFQSLGTYGKNLTGIQIYRYDEDIQLTYDYIGLVKSYRASAGTSKMLLASIYGNSIGKYQFEYRIDSRLSLPYNNTLATDHWGYWNGGANDLIVYDYISDTHNGSLYTQLTSPLIKTPDSLYVSQCALTKIVYPTGGISEISYELNSASLLFDRSEMMSPRLINNNSGFLVGGIRVKSITQITDNISNTYRYEYEANNLSSGILLKMPRYAIKAPFVYISSQPNLYYYYSITSIGYSFYEFCTNGGNHVTYSCVKEYLPDHSMNKYIFNNYDCIPDTYSNSSSNIYIIQKYEQNGNQILGVPNSDQSYFNLLLPPSIDRNNCRGTLKAYEEYDASGNLRFAREIEYDTLTTQLRRYINALTSFAEINVNVKSLLKVKDSFTRYQDGRTITFDNEYEYNELGQLRKFSKGTLQNTEMVCFQYYNEGNDDCDNLKSSPIGIALIKKANDVLFYKQLIKLEYSPTSNHNNPIKQIRYNWNIPPIISSDNNVFTNIPSGNLSNNISYTYNDNGRLQSVLYPGNSYIKYTWDNKDKYIISKEINAPANLYSYDWKEQVGLSKVTYPNMQVIKYVYDQKNRLSKEMDENDSLIKEYNYYIKNE